MVVILSWVRNCLLLFYMAVDSSIFYEMAAASDCALVEVMVL